MICILGLPYSTFADSVDVTITVRYFACNDGSDNDGDGKTDYPVDPGCASAADDDETDESLPQCNDTLDNDSDGKTDFPDDPECESTSDDNEAASFYAGSGGGGGNATIELSHVNTGAVLFVGTTSPSATVLLLQDGSVAKTAHADISGTFSVTLSDVTRGGYLFSLYTIDRRGVRSGLLSFHLDVAGGTLTETSNLFLPPTISVAASASGKAVTASGYAPPQSKVEFIFNSDEPAQTIVVGPDGRYSAVLPTDALPEGSNTLRAASILDDAKSPFSTSVAFVLGAAASQATPPAAPGDFNGDTRVNLVDFSVAAYWFGRSGVPARFDLSGDGVFDLRDFSIMVYHWSG